MPLSIFGFIANLLDGFSRGYASHDPSGNSGVGRDGSSRDGQNSRGERYRNRNGDSWEDESRGEFRHLARSSDCPPTFWNNREKRIHFSQHRVVLDGRGYGDSP